MASKMAGGAARPSHTNVSTPSYNKNTPSETRESTVRGREGGMMMPSAPTKLAAVLVGSAVPSSPASRCRASSVG
jgi:hypothetical protein